MLCLGQKVEYYNYGDSGIVKFIKKTNSATIFCDSLARHDIRYEVIDSIISRYNHMLLIPGNLIVITKNAMVIGRVNKKHKGSITDYKFVYEKVVYKNGLIEIYQKPKNKK